LREGIDCLVIVWWITLQNTKKSVSIASINLFDECSLEIYLYMKE